MSESQIKKARQEYRDRQHEHEVKQQQDELKRRIDYVNQSYEKMAGLRTKEAWKSFVYMRKELKKSIRQWQAEVNKVATPENMRLYYLGCVFGASAFFLIMSNVVRMKKDIQKSKFADILNHFRGGK